MVDLSLIKPENLWYTVGLIATDGNLSKNGRHINITSKDEEHMLMVRKALMLKNKLTKKSRGGAKIKEYSFLQFGDVKFYKFLLFIGLTPKKSLILKEIKVPKIYFADFLRGVIDGDGSIHTWIHPTNKNEQWALRIFSASEKFVQWLQLEIKSLFGAEGKIHISKRAKNSTLYQLKFGKFATKQILFECYNTNCLALKRKKALAFACLKSKDKLSKYGVFNARVVKWQTRST